MMRRLAMHAWLTVVGCVLVGTASGQDADQWRFFRGDPQSRGVSATTLPDRPEVLWKFSVDGGAFESSGIIVDGRIYIGDLDGEVYCLQLSDGDEIWKYETDSGFFAAPAYRDGRLYIGDIDGVMHCIDVDAGEQVWTFASDAEIGSSANFHQNRILFGSQDTYLYCLNNDGSLAWKKQMPDQIRCTPTIVGDRTFVSGCDAMLHIVDVADGEITASVEIGAPGMTPAVRGDQVFVGTESGVFFGINWRKAEVDWNFEDGRRGFAFRSLPAVSEQAVVFGSRGKRVFALDPVNGEELWRFESPARIDSPPVLVTERALIATVDGRLLLLNLADGTPVWQFETGEGFAGSPAVAAGRFVIASYDGNVYCFGEDR